MVTAAAAARGAQNYVTFETDFGPERTSYWHGVDFTLNARLRQGLTLQFGTQTGRSSPGHLRGRRGRSTATTADDATIKDLRNCRDVDPFQTTIRGLASYTVPKVDVLVSATVRSQPALERVATWQVPNTVIQGITRTAAAGRSRDWQHDHRRSSTTTIGCIADNRRTQIDMRFAKIFRFGSRRVDVGVDLGNLLNTNYATTYENTYQYSAGNTALGGTWNNPTAIYTPRFVRWNLTVDF